MHPLKDTIQSILHDISLDTRDLLIGTYVKEIHGSILTKTFLREYVGTSRPLVLRQYANDWPACTLWQDDEYLLSKVGDCDVTVAITPDGRADCPTQDGSFFAYPLEKRETLRAFMAGVTDCCSAKGCGGSSSRDKDVTLHDGDSSHHDHTAYVSYLQYQNSSLTKELPELVPDICGGKGERLLDILSAFRSGTASPPDTNTADASVSGPGSPILGAEATNIWIGDHRTATSWHRDHYENIYVVVRGRKRFRLLPPTDGYRMKMRHFDTAQWCFREENESSMVLRETGSTILWSSITPCPYGHLAFQQDCSCQSCRELRASGPPPLTVELRAGDVLYLPSCWWHEVYHGEGDISIAVNFWFDMIHDSKYVAMTAVDALAQAVGLSEKPTCHVLDDRE